MSFSALLRGCLLGLLLLGPLGVAGAETRQLEGAVLEGDVEAARARLIQQLFLNIGLEGELSVHSASASIDGRVSDTSVVRSVTRLSRFRVVEEELVGAQLRMVVEFERHSAPLEACAAPLLVRNVQVRSMLPASGLGVDAREALQGYLDELHAALARQHPMLLGAGQSPRQAAYLLDLRIRQPAEGGRLQLSVLLQGMDGLSAFELHRDIDPAALRERTRVALGYADLLGWRLTGAAERHIEALSAALEKPLRCLPVVIHVHAAEGEALLIEADKNPAGPAPATALFSTRFPLGRDFGVDFLKLERLLAVQPRQAGEFELVDEKKAASPATGTDGFVIVLP